VEAGQLRDGTPLRLRPLWPEDWRQFATGTPRVSERSLRMRFFGIPPLTERTFRRLTATDHADQFAWGAFADDLLVGVGRHALQVEDRGTAEVAFLVADDLQGNGVGGRLVTAVVAAAEAHGARRLTALARSDNTAIRRLLGRIGAEWDNQLDGTVEATWPVATAVAAVEERDLYRRARSTAALVFGDVTDH
jgi:RimJ/RimL family protein N-acetyltransferase